jgi:hypothetical protein
MLASALEDVVQISAPLLSGDLTRSCVSNFAPGRDSELFSALRASWSPPVQVSGAERAALAVAYAVKDEDDARALNVPLNLARFLVAGSDAISASWDPFHGNAAAAIEYEALNWLILSPVATNDRVAISAVVAPGATFIAGNRSIGVLRLLEIDFHSRIEQLSVRCTSIKRKKSGLFESLFADIAVRMHSSIVVLTLALLNTRKTKTGTATAIEDASDNADLQLRIIGARNTDTLVMPAGERPIHVFWRPPPTHEADECPEWTLIVTTEGGGVREFSFLRDADNTLIAGKTRILMARKLPCSSPEDLEGITGPLNQRTLSRHAAVAQQRARDAWAWTGMAAASQSDHDLLLATSDGSLA